MAFLHSEITLDHSVWVRDSILFRDESKTSYTNGRIIGISSYRGFVPSFKILLNTGAIFDFLTSETVVWKPTENSRSLDELVYSNCPSYNFAAHSFKQLKEERFVVYLKKTKEWALNCEYWLTIDWFTKNECLNLMALPSGKLAWIPNHKMMVWSGETVPDLPKYRAIKYEGKI